MLGKRYRLPSPPTNVLTVAAVTAMVFFLLAFGGKVLEGYRLRRHITMLRSEIAMVKEQREELQARLTFAQSAEYAEKVAREQFKWAKRGETLVIPVYRTGAAGTGTSTSSDAIMEQSTGEERGRWSEWWALLRNPLD